MSVQRPKFYIRTQRSGPSFKVFLIHSQTFELLFDVTAYQMAIGLAFNRSVSSVSVREGFTLSNRVIYQFVVRKVICHGGVRTDRMKRHRGILSIASFGGILLPPILTLSMIHQFAVNVPFWDEWDLVPFLVKIHNADLSFADFWAQHNEHRLASVKLLILPLAILTHYNVIAQSFLGFGLNVLSLLFLWKVLKITFREGDAVLILPLTAVMSCLLFSAAQHQNWLFGLASLQWYLSNLCASWALWALARYPGKRFGLLIGLLCTVISMLSLASGIAIWGICLVDILAYHIFSEQKLQWRYVVLWFVAATVLIAAYFNGFRTTSENPHFFFFLTQPVELGLFILIYLGSPFTLGSSYQLSAVMGLYGIIVLVLAGYRIFRYSSNMIGDAIPWLLLIAYALFVAVLTAIGRVHSGIVAATTNRYVSASMLFWVGIIVILAIALRRQSGQNYLSVQFWRGLLTASVIAPLAVGYGFSYLRGYRELVKTNRDLTTAVGELVTYETASEEALRFLYPPSSTHVREYAKVLESLKLSLFADNMAGERNRLAVAAAFRTAREGEGFLDGVDCDRVYGWAWDKASPDGPVQVDLYDGAALLATVEAKWFRWDLRDAGKGNGAHSFFSALPAHVKDGKVHTIEAVIRGTSVPLMGSPKSLSCEPNTAN